MKKRTTLIAFVLSLQSLAQKPGDLDSIARQFDKTSTFHGSILVARDGKLLHAGGYGYADASAKTANTVHTIYPIGSVTKQFTAAAIMKLQEQGKLSVQDKISKYFPTLKAGDKITIHQLLSHTSGLYNYTNDTAQWYGSLNEAKLTGILNNKPLDFEPGAEMRYCNSGYALAGYIIEKLTKQKYETVIRNWFFKPLGMDHSGFDFAGLSSSAKAKGYYDNGSMNMPARFIDSTVSFAAGSIYSTVGDLFKWAQAIDQKKLLQPASWAAMTTSNKNNYGYGLVMDSLEGEKRIWHNGGLDGFVSSFYYLPAKRLVVISLSNYMPSNLVNLNNVLAAALLGKAYVLPLAREEITVPLDTLHQYTGIYQLAPTFSITITVEDGKMMAQATGQQKFQVYAQKRDYFFFKVVDAQLEFERDDAGKLQGMTLHQNGMHLKAKKIQ